MTVLKKISLIIPAVLLVLNGFSQASSDAMSLAKNAENKVTKDLQHEVNIVVKGHTISKEKLKAANTLVDLNRHYKRSWVRTFQTVEITTIQNGKQTVARSENDKLTQAQKKMMLMADANTQIQVRMQYMPENTLKHNEMKEWDFKFVVNPTNDAEFSGGEKELSQYLKTHAIDKIPDGSFKEYDLTPVFFTIDEMGKITDVHLYQASENSEVDELLTEVVRNMPAWTPANYSKTHTVKQDFVLAVGNMKSCIVNTLNIREE